MGGQTSVGITGPIGALIVFLGFSYSAAAVGIFGWSEPVELPGAGIRLEAKLDTGADTSSLDATDIRLFRRGENRIVKFKVRDPETGEELRLERNFVRSSRIRRHFGDYQLRRVVELEICLGTNRRKIEVNLIDRSNFSYPMLLGRNALAGIALVDPAISDTSTPNCPEEDAEATAP